MAHLRLRPTWHRYYPGSAQGALYNPTLAYDKDGSPPDTPALLVRSTFSALTVPNVVIWGGFGGVPPAASRTITLTVWSAAVDLGSPHFNPLFNTAWDDTGTTHCQTTGGFPAEWTNVYGNIGEYFFRSDTVSIPDDANLSLFQVAAGIFGSTWGAAENRLFIYDIYLDIEYTPSFGYVIGRPMPARSAIQPLCQAFFFDGVESDGVLKFIPRGGASALTIPEADLGLAADGAKLTEQRGQEQDLPREVTVTYSDPALDYQQNKQSKRRSTRTVQTQNQAIIELPMAIDADLAAQIAEKTLYLAYLERRPYSVNLWKSLYAILDPTDIVTLTHDGLTPQVRIVKSSLGAGYALALSGVSEDDANYVSTAVGGLNPSFVPATGGTIGDTTLYLFDIPLIRDADANPAGSGYYFAMAGTEGWPGAVLYSSLDDSEFHGEASGAQLAIYGLTDGILGAPDSPWEWDTVNTLCLQMVGAVFANSTEEALLAGGINALLVGDEILQFRDATQETDGSWTISHLLRGRRGTEWACGSHADLDTVIDLSAGSLKRQALSLPLLNVERHYRAVTVGQDITGVASQEFTVTGRDLKPYAPVLIGGCFDADDNLIITWLRRTRMGGTLYTGSLAGLVIDGVGGPLNEEAEEYEVEIRNADTEELKRTITGLTTPTAIYTADQQTEDFGSPPASIIVDVYQISAAVGRGFAGRGTVPGYTPAPAVYPEGGDFYINGE